MLENPRKRADSIEWARHPRSPWSAEYRDRVRRAAHVYLFTRGYGDWAFEPGGLQDEIVRDEESGLKRYLTQKEIDSLQPNHRKRAPFTDGPRGTERELSKLRRDQDLVQKQLEMAHRQGNTKAIAKLREMERDLDRRVDALAFPEHTPNHSAVHYVWLVDYRGVPLDTEGPYGPMSLTRAEQFARIGAAKGEHDRVVSIGDQVMAGSFEILRRYRRGTGERTQ